MPYIHPDDYAATPAYDLLSAAARGLIGFDQRLIHALVDQPERSLPDLLRFAESEVFEYDLEFDFVAIFRHLNTPQAVPFYIAAIRQLTDDVPDDLTEAVTLLGAPMLEPLLQLYEEIGEEEGGDIAFMLAGLGIRDQRVLDLLLERLEYDAGEGALSLSLYGDPAAIPNIERILGDVPESDNYLRHELQTAIRQLQEPTVEPVPPDPFDILELYIPEAGPNFGILSEDDRLSLLSGVPAEIRADAAASFRSETLRKPVLDRLLEMAKSDPEANVRGRAWEALADDADDPEISRSLLAAAANAPLEERTGAIVALASGPDPDDKVLDLVEALYAEPAARAKTIEAMWKTLDPRFRQYMVDHFDDPDLVVRHHAIYGIGYLGIGSEASRLVPLFQDEDFRHDALLAYALAVATDISRSRIKPLLRRIEDLAGGLSEPEEELVKDALDQRLELHGIKPVFDAGLEPEPAPRPAAKVGRNDPCPCGSGRKYKKCHGA